jgi:nucleoside-diphosphate-sugar epimerase
MPKNVTVLRADIADAETLRKVLPPEGFDYVVNCGGYVDHAPYKAGGRALIAAHFDGLMNLIDGIDRDRLKGWVNIGSSDEYGSSAAPQSENDREQPISPYSLGKTAATHLLQMLHRTEGFPGVTLRLFLTYGPGQTDRRLLPSIIRSCLAGDKFATSEGAQLRDFCFIADTVEAIFSALLAPAAHGDVINIGSGQPVAIRQVVERVADLVGGGEPEFGALPYRPGESMALYADAQKAQNLLGWRATTSLDDGLRQTIDWVRTHP